MSESLTEIAGLTESGIRPKVTFTVFIPDERKAGGRYEEITDQVKKVDQTYRKVVLMGTTGVGKVNKTIDFDMIAGITIHSP